MTDPSQIALSVVDQSPIRKGGTPSEALWESVKLAQHAESVGYSRYWVAEHHNSSSFAGTSPEILIGQIAAQTASIRIGSGGVIPNPPKDGVGSASLKWRKGAPLNLG